MIKTSYTNTPLISSLGTPVISNVINTTYTPTISSLGTAVIPNPAVVVNKRNLLISNSTPVIHSSHTVVPVIDVNSDSTLKSKMVKHFMKKTFNKWIYDDFENVLKYLKIKGSNVVPIKNKKDRGSN